MIDSPFFGWVLGLLLALSIYVTYHQYPMLFFFVVWTGPGMG